MGTLRLRVGALERESPGLKTIRSLFLNVPIGAEKSKFEIFFKIRFLKNFGFFDFDAKLLHLRGRPYPSKLYY
jgi:hypothetical protein